LFKNNFTRFSIVNFGALVNFSLRLCDSVAKIKMFRTIEISETKMEFEGLTFVTVKSRALGARADLTLFAPLANEAERGALLREKKSTTATTQSNAPRSEQKNIPLVILLHGVYGSHWAWAMKGFAHRTLQRLVCAKEIPPLALAMPSDGLWGDGSGYVPHATQNFEKWIVEEVPAAAISALPCVSEKSALFIAGLSMGGFGALRIGAKYPEKFRAISGHSSITHFEQMKLFVEEDLARYGAKPEDNSVLETMLRNKDALPSIRFDCGTEDPLLEHNRELHQQLTANKIPHHYEEFPGGHEWKYWETHLADTLKFFAASL